MANARAMQRNRSELKRPIEELRGAIDETQDDWEKVKAKAAVIHWFKCGLHIHDNTALNLAAEGHGDQICHYLHVYCLAAGFSGSPYLTCARRLHSKHISNSEGGPGGVRYSIIRWDCC